MTSYPAPCPHCDHIADSMDSQGDSEADLDLHMERQHPDLPDPRHDPRWNLGEAGQ